MKLILAMLIIFIIFEIPTCIGMGLIFKKIKLDFKKGLIPFYNKIILIEKYRLPQYHLILIFIPIIGLYTNFCIYKELTKPYKKNIIYILELTLLPFAFNILLGLEIKEQEQEQIENYLDDQKNIYEDDELPKEETKDEYIWFAKPKIKNNTIYKASRNNLNAKVNINIKNNNEIIDNKNKTNNKEKTNTKICPKCGTKIPENTEICFICGTKL